MSAKGTIHAFSGTLRVLANYKQGSDWLGRVAVLAVLQHSMKAC